MMLARDREEGARMSGHFEYCQNATAVVFLISHL
jgi:hypothetical protein